MIEELDEVLKELGILEHSRAEIIHEMMGIKTIVEMNGVNIDTALENIQRVMTTRT